MVHVATYEHRHGRDVRVFTHEPDAWAWRDSIAGDWWAHEFGKDDTPPLENLGAVYFDRIAETHGEETFSVEMVELE
jgi:hypothetical protein